MDNASIAAIFEEIANVLELSGQDPGGFKVRAYRNAVGSITYAPDSLTAIRREGDLRDIPGIGDAIAKKIEELLDTGRLEYLETLRASIPPGAIEFVSIPGVGSKLARRLSKDLGARSIDELETAIEAGRMAALPGVGEKTVANLLKAIRSRKPSIS